MTSSCKKKKLREEKAEKIKALSGKWHDVDNYFQFIDFQSETDVNIRGLRYGYTFEGDSITFIDKEQYLVGVPRTTTHYFSVSDNQLLIKDLSLYTAADFYYQSDIVVFKKGAYPNDFLGEWYCKDYGFYIGFLSDKNVVSEALFPKEKVITRIDSIHFNDDEFLYIDTSYTFEPSTTGYSFTDTEVTFTTKSSSGSVINLITCPYKFHSDTLVLTITDATDKSYWSYYGIEYVNNSHTGESTPIKDTLVCGFVLQNNSLLPTSGAAYPF